MLEAEKSISPTVGQFYKVQYSLLDGKGGEIKILPAMCSKNDLMEHLFTFLKPTRQNDYFLNDSDPAWLNERDIRAVLPFPILTRRGEYQWEDKI